VIERVVIFFALLRDSPACMTGVVLVSVCVRAAQDVRDTKSAGPEDQQPACECCQEAGRPPCEASK